MTSVQLYVYDLSHGLASVYSTAMVGVHLDGVWHTSVVIDGEETYFQAGVVQCPAGKTHLGPPLRVIEMGSTEIPSEVVAEYLEDVAAKYNQTSYNLLKNNCNHFTNDFCQFLVGKPIPQYILDVAEQVSRTPFTQILNTGQSPM